MIPQSGRVVKEGLSRAPPVRGRPVPAQKKPRKMAGSGVWRKNSGQLATAMTAALMLLIEEGFMRYLTLFSLKKEMRSTLREAE